MPTIEETFEQAFIDALKPVLPTVIIESSPDDPTIYDTRGARGCILVRYVGSDDEQKGPAMPGGPTLRRAEMHLLIGSKSFRGTAAHTGTYAMLGAARETCSGLAVAVPNNEAPVRFFPSGDRFYREQNGVWWYVQRFRSTQFRSP